MIKKIALAAAVVSMFSVPAIASLDAPAAQGTWLQKGNNASGILTSANSHTYLFDIENTATVKIDSSHFPGASHPMQRMSAQLLDASGNVVVESQASSGDFSISEKLQPGQYRLVVSGSSGGYGDSWDVHRYNLNVSLN